jgi:DNA polymerase (family 10)
MDKADVARVLGQIAALLELKGENPFRVRAYEAAARTIASWPGDLKAARAAGALAVAKGIGPATLAIVDELLETGRSRVLDDLEDQVPPGLTDLLRISGLGIARVRQIHESLHVESLTELEEAARDGRLERLPRFGKKTAEKILKGIAFLRQAGGQRLAHHARLEANALARQLAGLDGVRRVAVAGSLRRCLELVSDLDFVVAVDGAVEMLPGRLRAMAGAIEVTADGDGVATLRLEGGTAAHVYPCPPDRLGWTLLRATGNAAHLAGLAERARAGGLAWEPRGLARGDALLPAPDEEAVYQAIRLPWIPPELREGADEIAAAAAGRLPRLVERQDLLGFLHCHTGYSDGTNTVDEWSAAGLAQGYGYLGITDHSPATAFAESLKPEDVPRQHAEIDAVNHARPEIRILRGVEADILQDGSLDYTPALRRTFDFIIASVHTRQGMDADQMTARVLTAMDDPTMTVLGHPTGRLLLSRDPFPLDLDRVFARAVDRGVAIEINADPQRLDLDWRVLRRAAAAGVTISIGADAHGTAQMDHVDLGLGIARKGWLTADRILNCRPVEAFLSFAGRRRRT